MNSNDAVEVVKPAELKLDPLKRKKYTKALREVNAFAVLGSKVLRIKAEALASIGDCIQKMGVKKIGHGKILVASEHAEESLDQLDGIINQEMEKGDKCDVDRIIALMQLKKEFNRQILESGHAHIAADRQPAPAPPAGGPQMAFPPGTPVAVMIGQPKQKTE